MSAPPATLRERTAEPAEAGDISEAGWRLEVGLRNMSTSKMDKRAPMRVEIREFQPQDYERLVEISNRIEPEHRETVEEARFDDEQFDRRGFLHRRYIACDPGTGAVVGVAEYNHRPWEFDPLHFSMWIGVLPERQRGGIGTALYDRLAADFAKLGATAIRAGARENEGAALAFLEHRGFRELHRSWESLLDLTSFDPARSAEHADPPRGIEITTLAEELAKDPERLRAAHDFVNRVVPDAPSIDPPTPSPFESFRENVLGPWGLPEGYFLAKDGDTYVGQSNLSRSGAMPEELYTRFTGVLREHRGRGIAMALKVRALTFAKERGYKRVRTSNSTLNTAMVGINMRLGFVKQPIWIVFGKDLGGGGAP